MVSRSLAFRIIVLSGTWIILALVITAILLAYFYRDHIAQHFDDHVAMHLEELVEASQLLPDGTFGLTFYPSDPRFHILHSGWYWEVRQSGETLKKSESLAGARLDLGAVQPGPNLSIHEITGPEQEVLRVQVVEMMLDPAYEPLVFLASAPMTGITDDVADYSNHIVVSFLVLGIGLILVVVLQVRVALKPLQAISAGIAEVREGRATRLPQDNLEDVQPLIDELNNLLEHNAELLKRARTQLGDLAHSVKNPLTVINNEARNMEAGQRDLVLQQTSDISRSVDHYLSRARAFGAGNVLGARSDVKAVVEDLVYAMQRIHQQRHLEIDFSEINECWFRGEGQDLEEMLGNLMDNACKWAKSRVAVCCTTVEGRVELDVEDDGPGIPGENLEEVMERGRKLDESKPGHGQGLGIVKDIAGLYGGSLTLERSQLGGLKAVLSLPAA
jgi:signal transduction histidine kinase